jgi:hypothetical protein
MSRLEEQQPYHHYDFLKEYSVLSRTVFLENYMERRAFEIPRRGTVILQNCFELCPIGHLTLSI